MYVFIYVVSYFVRPFGLHCVRSLVISVVRYFVR